MDSQDSEKAEPHDLERILQQIARAESTPDLLHKVTSSFESVLEKLSQEGIPAEQVFSGVRHGLGVAFGHHLGMMALDRMNNPAPTAMTSEPGFGMALRVPHESLSQAVRKAWPELRAELQQRMGFAPLNLRLQVDSDRWALCQGGQILEQRELGEDWKQELVEMLCRWMHAFFTLDDMDLRLKALAESSPATARQVEMRGVPLSTVHEVHQRLLEEGVSIRETQLIMTRMLSAWEVTREATCLVELVRDALAPWLCRRFQTSEGKLRALELSTRVLSFNEMVAYETDRGLYEYFPPDHIEDLKTAISEALAKVDGDGPLILFTDRLNRPALGRLCCRHFPQLAVLSWNEVHPGFEVETIGVVEMSD